MRSITKLLYVVLCIFFLPVASFGGVLLQENFDDTNFSSRGWYDSTGGAISTAEHIPGSAASFVCRFLPGGTDCSGGTPHRVLFTPTDTLYVSYWVKYSTNWQGQPPSFDHHEFLVMTNMNGAWDSLARTHLTAYIEQHHGTPVLQINDGQNIDESRVGQNLANITENRAVAGCNGDGDAYAGLCWPVGSVHWNAKLWQATGNYFSDSTGPTYKSDWHHIEAYFKLNSIANSKGIADGILQYWYDGKLIMDDRNVMLRTAISSTMKFNQFILAPYMGDGSPIDQTMWVDNLTIATARDVVTPAPPGNLK